ncbi:acetate kinase [Candidatus Woesearchaeota archaeon]|nr:acetate kinase [Candidatus Woesearchaeota archaeon]
MNVLVLNVGSSSVKFSVFKEHKFLFNGLIERIKGKGGYEGAIRRIFDALEKKKIKIDAIGNRIVHGGEIEASSIIDKRVFDDIKKCAEFAPLHNIPEIEGIKVCKKIFPGVKQIAVFDTAFHQTMPEHSYLYAIPYRFYEKYGIRRYGFHGTSHRYVALEAAKVLKKKLAQLKIITCHLGNGASVAAINKGKVVDTSMGFTPLEGLVMGTRCGDIDPAIVLYLIKDRKMSVDNVNKILNKESGLSGISGISSDVRDLIKSKSKRAKLALDVFCYRIIKYVGAYAAAMNGIDVVVFTGGIGENAYYLRSKILGNFGYLGMKIDEKKNKKNSAVITKKSSKIVALVIHTNEELMIAKEVARVLK